ncbi:Heptaprenyl diphosphate synthase (HEPPP synthase) subunit 1 [Thermoactinomyces sp. DSM 45891]|uniref:heptaprenyl diphosphate synthase component 1 n=1 Tax=Thermoactinomyces sp. DSM 45891 TaxID=1761907 RepID=UPI000912179E|nr:heptaprenyl diphosphate synthase component 1 [Thermoactinomyces sp. DSM 45891]SFX00895.1 Heptaprenyl diphosphate synthase (HEPPP synthase) subunit 1 [Thermoactinomyces sp. DSM 45891]
MTSISTDQNKILMDLERLVVNSDLYLNLGAPPIPTRFVRLLDLVLTACEVPEERKKTFVQAAACLHMALTTHEQIPLQTIENEGLHRVRQLTVLAGDFYSSLFYQQLAMAGEIDGIVCLSQATSRTNERKMKMYCGEETVSLSIRKIESVEILTAIAGFFLVEHYIGKEWMTVLLPLLLLDELRERSGWQDRFHDAVSQGEKIWRQSRFPIWLRCELEQWIEQECRNL